MMETAKQEQQVFKIIDARIAELRGYRLARNSYVPVIIHELERLKQAFTAMKRGPARSLLPVGGRGADHAARALPETGAFEVEVRPW